MKLSTQLAWGTLIACNLAIAACGDKGNHRKKDTNGGATPPGEVPPTETNGPFIAIDFFNKNYPGLMEASKSDVTGFINENAAFMQKSGSANLTDSENPSESKCFIVEDKITVVDSHNLTMSYIVDTSRCNVGPNENGEVEVIKIRAFASTKCSNSILDSYANSKALANLGRELCRLDEQQERLLHFEQINTVTKGKKSEYSMQRVAAMASDGSPCKSTYAQASQTRTIGNCGNYMSISRGTPQTNSVVLIEKIEGHNLVGFNGKRYYDSGYFDYQLNNWKGQITYGTLGAANADLAPTYSLKNSMQAQTLNGTYSYDPEGKAANSNEKEPEEPEE